MRIVREIQGQKLVGGDPSGLDIFLLLRGHFLLQKLPKFMVTQQFA